MSLGNPTDPRRRLDCRSVVALPAASSPLVRPPPRSPMTTFHTGTWLPLVALATAVVPCPRAEAGGTDLDLVHVVDPLVIQTIQTGSTPLVAGKSTVVRAPVGFSGTLPPGTAVDGLMRIFIGGIEAPGSPIYSDNGPIPVPLALNPNNENDSLNFIFLPPQTSNVVLTVEINPVGPAQVPESDFTNNSRSTPPLNFVCRKVPEIVYVPIDYRPSGGPTPNLPDLEQIAPGSGDNFMQGTYPAPDIDYRRSDFPSKLWTSSLSGTGSALNNSLLIDLQLMNPQPNFIYGWVPGGLPYNGQALGIPGKAAMGNTELLRYQRTFAHEVGHLHGLQHIGGTTGLVGFDVERHLALPLGLPTVKPGNLSDHMVAGLSTNQAWTGSGTYTTIFNNSIYNCATDSALDFELPTERNIVVAGLFDRRQGRLDITDTLVVAGGEPTPSVALSDANIILRAFAGERLVAEQGLRVESSADTCSECRAHRDGDHEHGDGDSEVEIPIAGFVAVLPVAFDGATIDRLEFAAAEGGAILAGIAKSAHAPVAAFAKDRAFAGDVRVEWSAVDADGDDLVAYLRYSPDGRRLVPLATQITGTFARVDFGVLPEAIPGAAFLELLVSDGFHTTSVRERWHGTQAAFNSTGSPPTVRMLSPDNNTAWRRGATVVLHSSGWDLEDRSLGGSAIQWTSSLDGPIGSGRVASVAELSVGTHGLTVTATDSRGMSASATATIVVNDRPLPGPGLFCQADLGFGGPGAAVLTVCGGDLSSGTTAALEVSGAVPLAPLWVAFGTAFNPTPILGGTFGILSPVIPPLFGFTSPAGTFTLPGVPGGNGPFSLFVQTVHLDPSQLAGFGLSNAVRIDVLP